MDEREVRFLQIEPTTRCNFQCGFCCGRSMEQIDIDFDHLKAIIEKLPNLEHVELQGEGEPLLHKKYSEMVSLLRDRNIKVSLISNGSLFSEGRAYELLQAGIEKIYISIESPDEERFFSIRKGSLRKVKENVLRLRMMRDALGLKRPLIGFSVTVLRSTLNEFPQIVELYRELGLDGGMTTQVLLTMESYLKTYTPEMREEVLSQAQREELAEISKAYESIRLEGHGSGFYDELHADWSPQLGTCPWLEKGLYVNCHGEATGCCRIKNTARYSFGNIKESDVHSLMNGRARMREALGNGVIPVACADCRIANLVAAARKSEITDEQNFTRAAVTSVKVKQSALNIL